MGRDRGKSKRGGRGGGRRRYVTSEEDLEYRNALEQQTQRARMPGSDDEDESGEESGDELPPIVERKRLSELEAEEEEQKSEHKPKGAAAVIDIMNPNRDSKQGKMMKTKDIAKLADDPNAGPKLSRKEREALEAEERKERERQRYLAGETEQARKDLARLAEVRKRREEAAKKREAAAAEEAKARDRALAATGANEESEDEAEQVLDSREIKQMNPAQLKTHLKARGLSIQGAKKELMTRLLEHEASRSS